MNAALSPAMIKTVIIDDEYSGRENLEALLARVAPEVEVVATAGSVKEGVRVIKTHQPDLVFLDVEMPTGTGFDILDQLPHFTFHLIFISAYYKYAIDAFRVSAIDYLLKPIKVKELQEAIGKLNQFARMKDQENRIAFLLDSLKTQQDTPTRIMLPTLNGFQLHHFNDIIRCQGERNYTRFFKTNGESILVSKNISEYEALLSEHNFMRVHRSHIINLGMVESYAKGKGGQVVMSDGSVIDVSRDRKNELISRLR